MKGINTPGLNEVIKCYLPDQINTHKDKFKQIFSKSKQKEKIFYQRPIDMEFLSYSAQDVKCLNEVADILTKELY